MEQCPYFHLLAESCAECGEETIITDEQDEAISEVLELLEDELNANSAGMVDSWKKDLETTIRTLDRLTRLN